MRAVRTERIQRLDVFINDGNDFVHKDRSRQHFGHMIMRPTDWIDGVCCWQDQSLLFDNCFGTNKYDRAFGPEFGQDAQATSLNQRAYNNIPAFTELQDRIGRSSTTLLSLFDRYPLTDRQSLSRRTLEHEWCPELLRLGRRRT